MREALDKVEQQDALRKLVDTAGWELFLEQLLDSMTNFHSMSLPMDASGTQRAFSAGAQTAIILNLRSLYKQASVSFPWDQSRSALYGFKVADDPSVERVTEVDDSRARVYPRGRSVV